jgi:hypothetical protein
VRHLSPQSELSPFSRRLILEARDAAEKRADEEHRRADEECQRAVAAEAARRSLAEENDRLRREIEALRNAQA